MTDVNYTLNMNQAYLLIGGNMGNRARNLERARVFLCDEAGNIFSQSSIYETAAWGKTDQPSFLNQALALETQLSARVLLKTILGIESRMGRFRQEKNGPRVIDIDIAFYNDDIIAETGLYVPHPEIQNRRFALVPLAELDPQKIHPVLKKSVQQLLTECKDPLPVKRLENL